MVLAGCAMGPQNNSVTAQTAEHPVYFPTTIVWPKLAGVSKYRLQISDDEDFRNVLFDVRLVGGPHNVCWLSPGSYYWRVAPSNGKTGAFLRPVKFFVSGGVGVSGKRRRQQGGRRVVPAMTASSVRTRGFKNVGS